MTDDSEAMWAQFLGAVKSPKRERVPGQPPCYCDTSPQIILKDLLEGTIPDEALVRDCCWKEICRVRGSNVDAADSEQWRELCRRRGLLLASHDPWGR